MNGSLSLRVKFLIAPIIGVLLTLIIYLTSNDVIHSQNQLFHKINDSNLVQVGEINREIIKLANNNSDIIALLLEAESLDEEQVYEKGKSALNQLYQIEQNLLKAIENSESVIIDNVDIFEQIKTAFSSYRYESISAIEMVSVDLSQALHELGLANKKLKVLNSLFSILSEYYLEQITVKANEIEGSLTDKTYINEIFIVLVILMIWVSFHFSHKVSKDLMQVYHALISLSKGDNDIEILQKKDAYIQRLWKAVNDFKKSISSNQKQKSELLMLKLAIDQHSIVSITDLQGVITYANEKFSEISGYSHDEIIGSNHNLLNSQNKSQAYWVAMYRRVAKGEIWHDEVRNLAKDGSFYWVDTTIIPIKELVDEGTITGYMSIRTDITSIKKQEKILIEARIIAEEATKTKSQFLATMSHEIRTPMNGVIGMAQLLKDTSLNHEQKDYLNGISSSSNNLLAVINDILDFSKLDFDAVELESIPFNLERVSLESLEVVAHNCKEKEIEFICDYHPEVSRYFIGDPSRIRQILLNLLGNAEKFTNKGHILLSFLNPSTSSNKEELTIKIEDTGIGIKEEALTQLFEEFSQADSSTTRKYGGTGLGLSIVKKLVTLMGGSISVESIYKQGSTFSLILPLVKVSSPELPLVPANNLKGISILLLETHPENRHIFKRILEHMQAQTTIAVDEEEALLILKQAKENNMPYQLLIIDNALKDSSDISLAKSIRSDQQLSNLKLLAFATASNKGDAQLYQKAGFNAYLTKLSRYETMLQVLSATLAHELGQGIITQHMIEDAKTTKIEKQTFSGKILLVEDIRVNQVIAVKMLTSLGFTVDVANDGEKAVDAVIYNSYDLIFMDCQMPVMDGYQATLKIREIEIEQKSSSLPIIALTANATTEDIITCKQSKMDDVITKPYQLADLQACLLKWLPEKLIKK